MQQNNKKLIINADDFGMSKHFNKAVLEGFTSGILTSACVCTNGEAFEHAMKEILPQCENMGIGIHLNIIEGKSLRNVTQKTLLCDKNGNYSNGFLSLMFKSMNKLFIDELEADFRVQIEKLMEYTKIDHINSHVHTHAIPEIFDLTCKLAKEYKIPYIRTQHEKFYAVAGSKKNLTLKFPINMLKVALLNHFTFQNKPVVKKYGLKTNDFLIGVGYTSFQDADTIYYGLKEVEKLENSTIEVLVHPCSYDDAILDKERHDEFLLLKNQKLKQEITDMGFELTNYKQLSSSDL